MIKRTAWILGFVLTSFISTGYTFEPKTTGYVAAEFRHADLTWNFKTPNTYPALKSSVHFSDLHIFQVGIGWQDQPSCCLYNRGKVSLGAVLDGNFKETLKNWEVSSSFNDPVDLFSKGSTFNVVDGRYLVDLSYGIGTPLYLCCGNLEIIPLIGYAYNEINLRVDQNLQLFSDGIASSVTSDVSRSIQFHNNINCDSKFIQRWWGPWIGLDAIYSPDDCWSLQAQAEYHIANFKGVRFTHIGSCDIDNYNRSNRHARGYQLNIAAIQKIWCGFKVGLNGSYQSWNTNRSKRREAVNISARWHSWGLGAFLARDY